MNEIEKIARRLIRKCVSEVDGDFWFDRTKAAAVIKEVLAAAVEQENARLREAISQTWKECDDARMSEVEDARKEADHWKAEGDMYGWNFHQGRAAGMVSASIIYHRIERAVLPK